ncbi:MAG: hypothetical protein BAJALOKI3v1_260016 [Promethearchaeota archaeon]|nr:MAG: hypothetical protein BAJALOKI3v1_260016 [Candidatus Lokiarchaeota archaeon]
MEIITLLAEKLASKIEMTPTATRGLIKLSIKDEVGPFKPIEQLDYDDLMDIINRSLKKRLEAIKVDNVDLIIKYLAKTLIENQSLITMGSV